MDPDPDPHQIEKVEALEGHFGEVGSGSESALNWKGRSGSALQWKIGSWSGSASLYLIHVANLAICRCIEFPDPDQSIFLGTDSIYNLKCRVSFYTLPPRRTSKLKKKVPAPQHKPIAFPNMNIFYFKKIQFRPPCTGFRIRIRAHGPLCIWIRNTTF